MARSASGTEAGTALCRDLLYSNKPECAATNISSNTLSDMLSAPIPSAILPSADSATERSSRERDSRITALAVGASQRNPNA